MAVTVTVNGVTRGVRGGFGINTAIDARWSASISIYAGTRTNIPDFGHSVTISEDGTPIFWGVVNKVDEVTAADNDSVPDLYWKLDCVDYRSFADNVFVTASSVAGTFKAKLTALVAYIAAAPYSVTLDPLQATGPTISAQTFNFRKLSDIIDELCVIAGGYMWTINSSRQLRAELPSLVTTTASFDVTDATKNAEGSVIVERARDEYANRVWVRAGANANEPVERTDSGTMPIGVVNGGYTDFTSLELGISYVEQPTEILVNGVGKTIGAPGTKNGAAAWEWIWQWVTTGSIGTMYPKLRHNDAVFGSLPSGTTLSITSKNSPFYNTVEDAWLGTDIAYTSGGYNWYDASRIVARKPKPDPWAIFLNGVAAQFGIFGTINEETGQPWDWAVQNYFFGRRTAASPTLTSADSIKIYTKAPYELLVQSPLTTAEPSAEQTTYGLTEAIYEAPDITTGTEAQVLADAMLIKRLIRPKKVRYTVRSLPSAPRIITPGQVQTITVANRGLTGKYMASEVNVNMDDGGITRTVTVIDSVYYNGSWRDVYRKWSATLKTGSGGAASGNIGTVIGGGVGGGTVAGIMVYFLGGSAVEAVATTTSGVWVAASPLLVTVNNSGSGTITGIVYAQGRSYTGGSFTVRLRNVTDNVVVGTSALTTSATFVPVTFSVSLTAGTRVYQLEVLPAVVNEDAAVIGYLEF